MGTARPKLLIIDDEVTILHALEIFLEQEGYDVKAVTEYGHYLNTLKAEQFPDVIILDILLLDEDGRIIAKELKANPKTKHIPIIMISAHPGAQATALRAGADAFLAKPFEVSTLIETISRFQKRSLAHSK